MKCILPGICILNMSSCRNQQKQKGGKKKHLARMLEDFFHVSSRLPPTTSMCLHKLLFPHNNTCFVTTAGGTQEWKTCTHTHHTEYGQRKKSSRGVSHHAQEINVLHKCPFFFLSLVLVCLSSFSTRGSQEELCAEVRCPPTPEGLVLRRKRLRHFFFWPVFSEFIPHAQTHMHHARTHVHTNAGEAETFHQKGVKTKHSFTVCLWHQHLKGWERRGTTSCTATTTPIFFQPTRTRIPAKGGETKQNRGQGWPPSFSLFLVVVSQSLQLWRECRQPATHCHERHNRDASVAASSR